MLGISDVSNTRPNSLLSNSNPIAHYRDGGCYRSWADYVTRNSEIGMAGARQNTAALRQCRLLGSQVDYRLIGYTYNL
jgi:hypothetical protein